MRWLLVLSLSASTNLKLTQEWRCFRAVASCALLVCIIKPYMIIRKAPQVLSIRPHPRPLLRHAQETELEERGA